MRLSQIFLPVDWIVACSAVPARLPHCETRATPTVSVNIETIDTDGLKALITKQRQTAIS